MYSNIFKEPSLRFHHWSTLYGNVESERML